MVLRRFLFPLRLARARLGAGGERLVLVGIGVVCGAAVLAAVLAGRLVMQDRALELAVHGLDPQDRTVQVVWSGATDSFAGLNRVVTPRVEQLTGEQPVAAMLFREASVQGRLVNLRAADDLDKWVTLVSGRLPTRCVPTHCEVLRLAGKGPVPATHYLNLIEVGVAKLKPDAPFAGFVLPAPPTEMVARAVRYHTPQPSPVVIANGVAALSHTPELETFYRAYGWFLPVGNGEVHPWTVNGFSRKVERLTASLEAGDDEFQVTAPTDTLSAATSSSKVAARRLLLLGGEGGALLIAFTILAAAALRRDVTNARRRLTWFGARRWQVELFTLAESATVATLGTVVGWVAGGAIAALVAARAGSPAGDVVTHGLLSTGGILAAAIVAVAAGALLYATVRAPAVQLGRFALTPLDMAAIGAVAVVLVGWARGSVGAQQLAGGGGTSAFLLLVPALIVFAGAVVAARVLAPVLRVLGRAGRRGPLSLRLAAASLARNPGHAAIAATFLVASLGLAMFAVAYRSTLLTGQRDEAAFAVPASYVLTEDFEQLVPVLHGAQHLPVRPTPIDRLSGNVPSGATFGFLALPARKLPTIGGWRSDFSSRSRNKLASALQPSGATLRTLALPHGRFFTLPATGPAHGDDIGVRAFFRSQLGDYVAVSLGHTDGAKRVLLRGRIPFRHATLAQLRFDILNNGRITANAGTGIQPSAKGTVTFGTPRVDGTPIPNAFANWVGTSGISGRGATVGYVLTPDLNAIFRPLQPTDGRPLPVLVTPTIAAAAGPHGIIPLDIEGEQIAARIVGVVQRFPSIVGDAVVADLTQAGTRLDTRSPGLGTPDELWLDGSTPPHAPELTVTSHAETLAQLRADPLARGALITLAGTAAVALLLALLGLVLSVVGDVRDDRGELFDLEAQGASPATIRRHLRLRSSLVAAFGILGGVALGAILSALVISLVSVTASAAEPEPPLRLELDVPLLALAAVAYVAAAMLLVGLATALRGRAPAREAEVAA
ncbi:MAG TPA: FtsX-like permease family protein [Gaiellaceae bacterium]|nr:FtsX-like permease family protein [Gaiellaceae bacterium]